MRDDGRTGTIEPQPESWSEKIAGLLEAGRRLAATRSAILREELSVKAGFFGRGLGALFLAAAFAMLALLLFTAWIAALFTKLLGGPVAGILAAFGLYLVIAAVMAMLGVRSLSRVKPGEFPVTKEELRKDWASLKAAAKPPQEPAPEPPEVRAPPSPGSPHAHDDLEARFRAGAE
jgi:putative superfamily III holin-X